MDTPRQQLRSRTTLLDISDSTDWLNTPLSALSGVETALRCQVCKDFFDTPMITECSHTFCSLCIRRALSSDGKCPACRADQHELRLRRNWALEELVDTFTQARPDLLRHAKSTTRHSSPSSSPPSSSSPDDASVLAGSKRKLADTGMLDGEDETKPHRMVTRSSSRLHAASASRACTPDAPQDERPHKPPEEKKDGYVACPICNKRMRQEAVFNHLDVCNGQGAAAGPAKRSAKPSTRSPPVKRPRERLPKITYHLLKDRDLRRKMKDLGLPDWGPKQLLTRRHMEWVNLWNASCDSSDPKPKRELLQDLDVWERSQGGLAAMNSNIFASSKTITDKNFDAAAWSESHSDDFKTLIAYAKQSKKSKNAPTNKSNANSQSQETAPEPTPPNALEPLNSEQYQTPPNVMPSLRTDVPAFDLEADKPEYNTDCVTKEEQPDICKAPRRDGDIDLKTKRFCVPSSLSPASLSSSPSAAASSPILESL